MFVMIKSFKDKDTESIYKNINVKKYSKEISKIALRKLIMIDAANALSDLKVPPGNRLEKLTGDKKGFYSIRINDQYRICFKPNSIGNEYYEVEICDYH